VSVKHFLQTHDFMSGAVDIFWLTEYRRQFSWKSPENQRRIDEGTETVGHGVVDRGVETTAAATTKTATQTSPVTSTRSEATQVSFAEPAKAPSTPAVLISDGVRQLMVLVS
jgi:hypothetical protein